MPEQPAAAAERDPSWLLDDFAVTAAVQGSCVAVLCPPDADAGVIAHEMATLVKRAGPHPVPRPRFPATHGPAG